jgi:hypothetical protein
MAEDEPASEGAPTKSDSESAKRLEVMVNRVEDVEVAVDEGSDFRALALVDRPLIRYSDEERRILDATLWVWLDGTRPGAIQKMECGEYSGSPVWTVCYSSLSSKNLKASWPATSHGFTTSTAGCEFKAIPDGPKPQSEERLLKAQIRQLSRRFGFQLSFQSQGKSVARLLTRPLYEYSSPEEGILAGALFGFASYGTNPDAYVMIELRKTATGTEWVYGFVRMTIYGMVGSLDDKPVFELPEVKARPMYFENWTFFFEPRTDFLQP